METPDETTQPDPSYDDQQKQAAEEGVGNGNGGEEEVAGETAEEEG